MTATVRIFYVITGQRLEDEDAHPVVDLDLSPLRDTDLPTGSDLTLTVPRDVAAALAHTLVVELTLTPARIVVDDEQ